MRLSRTVQEQPHRVHMTFSVFVAMDGDDRLRSVLVSQIASHHYSLTRVDHMTVLPGQGTGYRELREH